MIRKEKGQYVVFTEDGQRVLGKHFRYETALILERVTKKMEEERPQLDWSGLEGNAE